MPPAERIPTPVSAISSTKHPLCALVCYANQPVVRVGDRLIAPHRNFVDLLAHLVKHRPGARLVVPVVEGDETTRGFPLDVPLERVVPVSGYDGHVGSLLATVRNGRRIRQTIRKLGEIEGGSVALISTIPSSMFSWQLLRREKGTRFVGVARGDTRRTLANVYRGSWRWPIARGIVDFFLATGRRAQRRGDLLVFGVGGDVLESLDLKHGPHDVIHPLLHRSEFPDLDSLPARAEGPVRFLSLGRLSREKAIPELLDAAARLRADGVDFELTIAGFGPLEEHVRTKLAGGLEDRVRFVGAVDPGPAVYELMLRHDVLVLPSRTEGVPRTVSEAAAAGRLILATRVGSIPETFGDGVHYIDSSTPESIVRAMRWAIDHPDGWPEHVRSARATAEGLTIEAAAERIGTVVDGWVGEGGGT